MSDWCRFSEDALAAYSAQKFRLSCHFFEQLWLCCNTLTISQDSPTAERIA